MPTIHVIYASTSGHTEYVLEVLEAFFREKHPEVSLTTARAERATVDDFVRGDALLLGCGTWNIDGTEGKLNPLMHALLNGPAAKVDLQKKPCGAIALGDAHYYYTGRAGEHLRKFILSHNGHATAPSLMLIDEPFGQEAKIHQWGDKLVTFLTSPLKQ